MALFDARQYDPSYYQGNGLLGNLTPEMLLRSIGQDASPQQPQTPMQPQTGPTYAAGNNGMMGGVPFPIMGQPDQAAIPPNAQPAQYQQQPQQQPQAQQTQSVLGGIGDHLTAGIQGMANSKSPMQGLANLFGGLTTGQRSDPAGLLQQQQAATLQALVRSGVPEPMAQAAALNPDILKTIAPEYFGGYKPIQTGEGPLGKTFMMQGPGGKLHEIGAPSGPGSVVSAGGTSQGGLPGGTMSLTAPGVKFNPQLTGDDYLNQFSPEVKAAVKSYMSGDVMPSGNPRNVGIANLAKTIAQKYGADTGIPVSDANYSEKRTYRSSLGSNSASAAGGQAKAFNQGIEHMEALATTLEKLDNSNGLGIPMIAGGVNKFRQAVSTEQSAVSDKAQAIGQTLAGEVGKLFSGSAGGGVHEREMTRDRFKTVNSPPQLAAALEATLEVMRGGLTALEQRRDQVLGPNSGVQFVSPETQHKIEKIEGVIQRLKSGQAAPDAAPSAPAMQTAINPTTGQRIQLKGGQWVPMQ